MNALRIAASFVGLALASTTQAQQTFDWVGADGAFFSAPASWTPQGFPTGGDYAHFFLDQAFTVNFATSQNNRRFLVGAGDVTLTAVNPMTYDLVPLPGAPCIVAGGSGVPGLTLSAGPNGESFQMRIFNPQVPFHLGETGPAHMNVTSGTRLMAHGPVLISNEASGDGVLTVAGADAVLDVQSVPLRVGGSGEAVLRVLDGGVANVHLSRVEAAIATAGSATIHVSGSGSLLTVSGDDGDLLLGQSGHAELRVDGGATAQVSNDVRIGGQPLASVALVTDAGSQLEAGHEIVVGPGNALVVLAGATAHATDVIIDGTLNVADAAASAGNDFSIANEPGSAGTVTVSGPTASITSTSDVFVGNLGDGTLDVTDGGQVHGVRGTVGRLEGSTSIATLSGPGTTWSAGGILRVGVQGEGALNILDGATADATFAEIGRDATGVGFVFVSGDGATLETGASLVVGGGAAFGAGGFGSVTIGAGGTVATGNLVQVYQDGQVNLSGGTLATSLVNLDGGVLASFTDATLDAEVVNDGGLVDGPTGQDERLRLPQNVSGDGHYAGNLQFSGSFDPGPNIQQISFGSVTFDSTALLRLDLQGTVPGVTHDRLSATGFVTLGGALDLRTCCEFPSLPGEQFEIISGLVVTGEFDSVEHDDIGGLDLAVIYGPDSVVVEVVLPDDPCPGDFDGNGIVDVLDLVTLISAWGSPDADTDGDGTTGVTDLVELIGAWGACG